MKKNLRIKKYGWYAAWAAAGIFIFVIASLGELRIFLPTYFSYSGFPFWQKTYLVLLQNSAELRPGGGFISAVAEVRFTAGIPTKFSIQDVYNFNTAVSVEEPPAPLKKAIQGPDYRGWIFQDANYFADFPTNAEKLIALYGKSFPDHEIDGVVAVNTSVLTRLLEIVGPVAVQDQIFDANSLFPRLEFAVNNIDRHNVEDLKKRKDIIKSLFSRVVFTTITSPLQYGKLASAVAHSLDEKEIQIFMKNTGLQKTFSERGWTNTIDSAPGEDFLAVVEANLGGMKSDEFLERSVRYHVDIPSNGGFPKAKVQVHLAHRGVYNEPLSFTYKGFLRILTPSGSILMSGKQYLIDSERISSPSTEKPATDTEAAMIDGKRVEFASFGQSVVLEPGEEKIIEFNYQLPLEFSDQYHLSVHKQSGTNDPYSITVSRDDDSILSGTGWDSRANTAFYQTILTTDRNLSLDILPDQIPPRLTFQKFLSLNTIELHTNEPIDKRSCEAVGNFVLTDGNVNHREVTDQPRVLDAVCNGQGITLTVSGVSKQNEEHYKLSIKNLTDRSGNAMKPSPLLHQGFGGQAREFTVVQRF